MSLMRVDVKKFTKVGNSRWVYIPTAIVKSGMIDLDTKNKYEIIIRERKANKEEDSKTLETTPLYFRAFTDYVFSPSNSVGGVA